MMIVTAYDISNPKRLAKAARICENYGRRIQNSLYECELNEDQFRRFKSQLLKVISFKEDSLRFYKLGNKYRKRIEYAGKPEEINDMYVI